MFNRPILRCKLEKNLKSLPVSVSLWMWIDICIFIHLDINTFLKSVSRKIMAWMAVDIIHFCKLAHRSLKYYERYLLESLWNSIGYLKMKYHWKLKFKSKLILNTEIELLSKLGTTGEKLQKLVIYTIQSTISGTIVKTGSKLKHKNTIIIGHTWRAGHRSAKQLFLVSWP